jgi:hypothetical protein
MDWFIFSKTYFLSCFSGAVIAPVLIHRERPGHKREAINKIKRFYKTEIQP